MASSSLECEDKWSGLPKELLELILKRLPVIDDIRFGAVCKTWLSVRIDAAPLSTRQPPWLLIDDLREDNLNIRTRLTFKSSSEGQTYEIDAPYLDSKVLWQCIGVSYGWLIMTCADHGYFNLLNPISNEFIKLPSWDTYVEKAILSSSPESGCCGVVMITGNRSEILTCRFGDEDWTVTNKGKGYYKDLAFYKGHVYILNMSLTIHVYSYDWQQHCLKRLYKAPNHAGSKDNYQYDGCHDFLVGMGDDLLYIWMPYLGHHPDLKDFAVFKLHKDGTQWESVQSFGNATLFLEWWGGSKCLSADELVGTDYRMNSVYFIYHDEIIRVPMGEEERRYIQRLPVPYGSLWYMPRLC